MRLQTIISDQMKEVLDKRAWETGLSVNELVRIAIVNSYMTPVFMAKEEEDD